MWAMSYVNNVDLSLPILSPLHFTFLIQQVLLDLNKTKTRGKTKNPSLRMCMIGVHGTFLLCEMIAANGDVETA